MEQPVFIFIGVMAMLTTFAIWRRFIHPKTMIVASIMWMVWTFGATNVTITDECCTVNETYWSLALIGIALAGATLVFWVGALLNKLPEEGEMMK